ncbi:MAG: amidase [Microthrixaceae bacterium]|nr:amidase [Microthrixaceae bacterium]
MTGLDEILSVERLAAGYRRRRSPLSPLDVVEMLLERIAGIDGAVRSMVTLTPEIARRGAVRAAERIAQGDPSPLLGVPVVLKDLIDVRGVRTTAGSAVLHDNVAKSSSVVWSRLQRGGAVLLGKANTHEFAYGGTTEPTVNPWDRGRLVGGSSGGPAAALAAGLAPLAVGTDTAGSVRIPANLCGVYGLKPTNAMVATKGVIPLAPSLDVVGPMGHRPRDLAVAMESLGGSRYSNRRSGPSRLGRKAAAKSLRFAYLDNPGPMSVGVARAYDETIETASRIGRTSPVSFGGFDQSVMVNFTILGVEAAIYHRQWASKRDLYSPYVRERLDAAAATSAVDYELARRSIATYRSAVDSMLADADILILPGVPFAAPRLGATVVEVGSAKEDRDTAMCRNTGFANFTGHPVLAMPVGFEAGLPVGVQVLGERGADAELLEIGGLLSSDRPVCTVAPEYAT